MHESIYDAMCDELAKWPTNAVVGDGLEQGTQMGPLQNKTQFEKVLGFLEGAAQERQGHRRRRGMGDKGYFIEPTIVRDIDEGSRLVDEEQFGPVLPVIKYSDNGRRDRAAPTPRLRPRRLDLVDGPRRAPRTVASQMEAGTVWINKHADMAPNIPFGGAKLSGIGTELGEEGLEEFTQLQIINGARCAPIKQHGLAAHAAAAVTSEESEEAPHVRLPMRPCRPCL